MTRTNSAASRAARETARAKGISYTAALYAQRDAARGPVTLVIAAWGPHAEILVPITDVHAGTTYRFVFERDHRDRRPRSSIAFIGAAAGYQLLAQPRMTHPWHGEDPLVDIRPFVDFDTHRDEYGIRLTVGVVSFELSVTIHNLFCDGCPYRDQICEVGRALDAAREHNDQHVEFPGDWGYQRTPEGRWRRIRA